MAPGVGLAFGDSFICSGNGTSGSSMVGVLGYGVLAKRAHQARGRVGMWVTELLHSCWASVWMWSTEFLHTWGANVWMWITELLHTQGASVWMWITELHTRGVSVWMWMIQWLPWRSYAGPDNALPAGRGILLVGGESENKWAKPCLRPKSCSHLRLKIIIFSQ